MNIKMFYSNDGNQAKKAWLVLQQQNVFSVKLADGDVEMI